MLGGYHEHHEVFAFWDDDLHEEYGSVSLSSPKLKQLVRPCPKALAAQQRATAGLGGETVIVAKPGRVAEALKCVTG